MSTGRILVVEDDPAAAKDIQSLLVDSGYEVVIAGTGGEGLETAKSHTDFSLVISDYHMPNMDGLAMCEALRRLDQYREVPMFMISSELNPRTKARGNKIGILTWIAKPYNPDDVLAIIVKALARKVTRKAI